MEFFEKHKDNDNNLYVQSPSLLSSSSSLMSTAMVEPKKSKKKKKEENERLEKFNVIEQIVAKFLIVSFKCAHLWH